MVACGEEGQMVVFLVTVIPLVGIGWYEVHFQIPGWRDPLDRIARWCVRHPYVVGYLVNDEYNSHNCCK